MMGHNRLLRKKQGKKESLNTVSRDINKGHLRNNLRDIYGTLAGSVLYYSDGRIINVFDRMEAFHRQGSSLLKYIQK